MKRFFAIALSVALFATSCSYTDEGMDIVTQGSRSSVVAYIDNSHTTRTTASVGADGTVQMLWHQDDQIALSDGISGRQRYNLVSGEGTTEATFEYDDSYYLNKEFQENVPLYAISPMTFSRWSQDIFYPYITSTQMHLASETENDVRRNLMIAKCDAGESYFDFKLAASLARLNVTVNAGELIEHIRIETDSVAISGNLGIDWEQMSVSRDDEKGSKYINLTYESPSASPSSDGYVVMAPIDWTTAEGNVYYTVTTDKNVYKFCKKPTKRFEAGFVYNFPLDINKFELVDSEDKLSDGKYCCLMSEGSVAIATVRSTDSTISIAWTGNAHNYQYFSNINPTEEADYATDITKTYKVALYKDAAGQDLVVSVDNISGSLFKNYMVPSRFVFAGLAPATTYYAKVYNTTDSTESKLLEVATIASVEDKNTIVTSDAKAGDLIVFENFSSFIYGGELSARAAGVSRTDRGSLTEIEPLEGEIVSSGTGYYAVHGGTEIGLFNTLKGLVDDFGLQDWGYIGNTSKAGGSVCARAGFLKVGTVSNCAAICTPELSAIPEGKAATVKVKFCAAPYGEYDSSMINDDERRLAIRALADPQCTNYKVTYTTEACQPYIFDLNSYNITRWREYEVTLTNVPHNGRIAIGGAHESIITNRFLVDDIRVYVEQITDYVKPDKPIWDYLDPVSGTITYTDGTPAADVAVSDGFTVVKTDSNGKYSLNPHKDCWYIYYSIPENCQVSINDFGQPCFYTKFDRAVSTYDFTLTKLAAVENKFTLFCLADPQCKDDYDEATNGRNGDRFKNESVPDIKAHAATMTTPCYGVTLGDIVYSEGNRNNEAFMPTMRDYMAADKIGMPIFQTIGNHDYTFFSGNYPIYADETSSTFNMKAQRAFETVFGPINYSWNRGNAHIISMRNMHWSKNTDASGSSYSLSFTDLQVEWLRQDLALVPKDKLIIFCVHIPMLNQSAVSAVTVLLQQFPNCHIMSGHTHYMRNEPTRTEGIYEHVHAAVSGQWWWSNINGDGVPNGYGVYEIEGNKIVNGYYKGVNKGMNDRDYQIRLYRGNLKAGTEQRSFNLMHGNNVIIANVFNASPKWKVEIFADGVSEGEMTFIKEKKYQYHNQYDDRSIFSQDIPEDSCQDWWAIGYHIGVIKRETSGYYVNNFHMYKHTLQNKDATEIRVEATDEFGRKYVQTKITGDYDYSEIDGK